MKKFKTRGWRDAYRHMRKTYIRNRGWHMICSVDPERAKDWSGWQANLCRFRELARLRPLNKQRPLKSGRVA